MRKKRGRGYVPRTSCLSVREEATSWQSPTTEVSTLHCGRFTTSPATRDWLESPSQCMYSWLRFYHCAVPLAHGSCLVSVHVYKGPDLIATLMACVSAGSGTLCDAPCPAVLDRVILLHDEIYRQQARAWAVLEPDWEAVSGGQAVKGSDPIHTTGVATSTTKGKATCGQQGLPTGPRGLAASKDPGRLLPGMRALFWEEQNKQLGSPRWRLNVLCRSNF